MQNTNDKIAKLTLELLKTKKWENISLNLILKKLKIDNNKLSNKIKNKNDLLININKYFDKQINMNLKSIEKSSKRDMIFEILMMRFDMLNKYRAAINKIFKFFLTSPNVFVYLLPAFIQSIKFMAKNANIDTRGIRGVLITKGLLVVYFSTFLTWIKDENSSLDKTMTMLDNYLNRAEYIIKLVSK